MTALRGREAKSFLARRDPAVPLVLLYGPDQGAVRNHAKALALQVVSDINDPWSAVDMTAESLAAPGHLSDEVSALSFSGGERLVSVRGLDDRVVTPAVKLLLDGIQDGRIKPSAITIVEAGDLKPTSGLRKLCEQSKKAVAIGCYHDGGRDLSELINARLAAEDLEIGGGAMALLSNHLGDDRGISLSEIDKLILYMGPKTVRGGGRLMVTEDDVRASLVDSAADATFDVVDLMLVGDTPQLSVAMRRAATAGASPLAYLRIAQNKIRRLLQFRILLDEGQPPAVAMKAMRPPARYPESSTLETQIKRWSRGDLQGAAASLMESDLAAKTTGAPQRELVERAFLRLCVGAARRV